MVTQQDLQGDKDGLKVANWLVVARHVARRIKESMEDVPLLEVCSGIGATTIELANEFSKIYAVEIEEERIEFAKNNLGELSKKVDFFASDIFDSDLITELKTKNIQTIETDVEWTASGIYGQDWAVNIEDTNPNTKKLFELLKNNFTENIVMRLPVTIDRNQLRELGECKIEEIVKDQKVKFLYAYFGKLKNREESQFISS